MNSEETQKMLDELERATKSIFEAIVAQKQTISELRKTIKKDKTRG